MLRRQGHDLTLASSTPWDQPPGQCFGWQHCGVLNTHTHPAGLAQSSSGGSTKGTCNQHCPHHSCGSLPVQGILHSEVLCFRAELTDTQPCTLCCLPLWAPGSGINVPLHSTDSQHTSRKVKGRKAPIPGLPR